VFDLELMRETDFDLTGDELLNTLKRGPRCVEAARPEVRDVLRQLEEIRSEGGGVVGAIETNCMLEN
jgi:hypothetical protein